MDVLDTIGKRIRASRKNLGLDQRALAKAAGVHEKTVSRWENDAMAPDAETVSRIAGTLEIDAGWLLTGKGVEALPNVSPEPGAEASRAADRLLRSHAVRVWLADFQAELTHARADDEEIERALQLAKSASVLTFYSRGKVRALSEDDAITALEAIAVPIRAELKRRGRKFG